MDRSKLFTLIDKIKRAGYSYDTETVLTIEDFFDGNDDVCSSICANIADRPSTAVLRDFLLAVRERTCVSDVLIRVYEFEDALASQDTWITSDTVYVISSASVSEVHDWFRPLSPSAIGEESELSRFNNLPDVPEGARVIAVWWD